MAKDMIIGVVDRYDWDKIKYWANSIKKSGFTGHKALIVYNMDAPTVQRLTLEEFILVGCNQYDEAKGFSHDNSKGNVMVDRFFHISNFLNMLEKPMDVDRVIITDVRDVVFQKNPTEWLDTYFLPDYNLVVGSENLTYENEPWGKNNITKSFGPLFYDRKKDQPIFCAGVIAGRLDAVRDLCLNVWLTCFGLNPNVEGGGGPDQAALNILLDMDAYHKKVAFTSPSNCWVLHAGTSLPAIQAGSGGIGQAYVMNNDKNVKFIEHLNYSINNGIVNIFDNPVTVLHQWDRVPEWKKMIEEKYGTN